MIKGILWDIDDVIRKYSFHVFGYMPQKWMPHDDPEWRKAVDLIKGNVKYFLEDAPCYNEVVNNIKDTFTKEEVTLLSCQGGHPEAEEATTKFIEKTLGYIPNIVYVENFEGKLKFLEDNPDTLLIDDYPNFVEHPDFTDKFRKRIILFDQPHNRMVKSKFQFSCNRADLKVFDKDNAKKFNIIDIHRNLVKGVCYV